MMRNLEIERITLEMAVAPIALAMTRFTPRIRA